MENEIDTEKTIWQKNQQDLTVGESVQLAIIVGTAVAVLPMVVVGIASGVKTLRDLRDVRQARKLDKKLETLEKR